MKILFFLIQYCYQALPPKIQRSLQSTIKAQDNKTYSKIEFQNGDIQKVTNCDVLSNQLHLIDSKSIFYALLKNLFPLENVLILVILIILYAGQKYSEDDLAAFILHYTTACLVLDMTVSLTQIAITCQERIAYEQQINNNDCLVFVDLAVLSEEHQQSSSFKRIKWRDLQIGQIVCLENDETSPADLLILDASSEQIMVEYNLRVPCSSTFVPLNSISKGVIIDFKINLSGWVQFTYNGRQLSGTLKLKNDPKVCQFDSKNLILRGEKLDSTNWLYGLVIRVGSDCINIQTVSKDNFSFRGLVFQLRTQLVSIFLIVLVVMVVARIVYDALIQIPEYFFSNLSYCLLFVPQNLLWVNRLWLLLSTVINNHKYHHNHRDFRVSRSLSVNKYSFNDLNVLQEDESKVLIPIPKHNRVYSNMNQNQRVRQKLKKATKGYQTLSSKTILDLAKTDLVIVENPYKIFTKRAKVLQVLHHRALYIFNHEKLTDLMQKNSQMQKINFDKLLIDTNRFQTYDEQKVFDLDVLISEKAIPPLRPILPDLKPSFQKPGFFREKSMQNREKKPQQDNKDQNKQLNPYASFRKASARNLFNSNGSLGSNSNQNSPKPVHGQQKFFAKSTYFNRSQNQQQPLSINGKSYDPIQSSDRLLGDALSETEFFDKLVSKDDQSLNELLIMMLVCNNIGSYYNTRTHQLQLEFSNRFDPCIIEFANQFDYHYICSTQVDNFKEDYIVSKITKKVLSIQGTVKVFEILAVFEPTESRQHTLSVLIRDPESFLLDEGALLYTRIETHQIQGRTGSDVKDYNRALDDMLWDGQKTFIYGKRQLNAQETQSFLRQLSQISVGYSSGEEELDKLYSELESSTQLVTIIGLKQVYGYHMNLSAQEVNIDNLSAERIFINLQNNLIRVCVIIKEQYQDLIVFLRTYQIINSKDQIVHFHEKDVQPLTYRFRQHIAHMIDEQLIFTSQPQQNQRKFLVFSQEAFETIMSDDYLKYHLTFISQHALGIGCYQFQGIDKGKFVKQLRYAHESILCIGNSFDNNYYFNKSDASFTINNKDPLVTVSKPNFMITNIKQIIIMLLRFCPQQLLNYTKLLEVQIYRCLLLAFLVFQISFDMASVDLYFIIIFFLLPSNLFVCIFQYRRYFHFPDQIQTKEFNSYAKKLHMIKQVSLFKQIIKVSVIALFDSLIIHIAFRKIETFETEDGRALPSQISVILYACLELTEKAKIIPDIMDDISISVAQRFRLSIFIIILLISLIFGFQLVYTIDVHLSSYYTQMSFIDGFFCCTFCVCLSHVCLQILKEFSISFTEETIIEQCAILQGELERIIPSLDSSTRIVKQKSARSYVDKLLERQDIIDEQIVKYLKGENTAAETMLDNLQFADKRAEKEYLKQIKYESQIQRNSIVVFVAYESIIVIHAIYQIVDDPNFLTFLIISMVQFLIQLVLFVVFSKLIINRNIQNACQMLSYLMRFIFKILLNINHDNSNQSLFLTALFCLSFSTSFISKIGIYQHFALCSLGLIIDVIFIGVTLELDKVQLTFTILKACAILALLLIPIQSYVYKIEFLWRYQFILQNRLMVEYKKLNDTLGLLMPRFIKERMTKGQIQISEDQGEVTILFCDICDFDNIIKAEQENIVEFLDNLYRTFDQLCQSGELQKIETVGKTYMAAAGLREYDVGTDRQNSQSTQRVLDVAIKMMEAARQIKFGNNQEIVLKIGIHYGRVIAGVIGAHKPQFSLIGDTVNTTSRVCSTGEYGFITLSEAAYTNVKDIPKYRFQRKEVQAKGKGLMLTYKALLLQREGRHAASSVVIDKKSVQPLSQKSNDKQESKTPDSVKAVAAVPTPLYKKTSVEEELKQKKKLSLLTSETGKSPKNVLRQRHKDLQVRTPMMIIRKLNHVEIDIQQSNDKPLDYSKQMSQNQLLEFRQATRNKSKSIINRTQNQILMPELQKEDEIKILEQEVEKPQTSISNGQIHVLQKNGSTNTLKTQHGIIKQGTMQEKIQIVLLDRVDSNEQQIQGAPIVAEQKGNSRRQSTFKRKGTLIIDKKAKRQGTRSHIDNEKEKEKEREGARMIAQKSIKQFNEGTLSAAFKSPQEQPLEKIDEIEIPKIPHIIDMQKPLSAEFVKQVLKCKVDQYQVLLEEKQVYKSTDHSKYNEIYEEYKQNEFLQLKKTLLILSIGVLALNLLYLIITDEFSSQVVPYAIVLICQAFFDAIIIAVLTKVLTPTQHYLFKLLLALYCGVLLILNVILTRITNNPSYDIVLQFSTLAVIYINVFNLQIFNQADRHKLCLLYFVVSLMLIIYQIYWFQCLLYTIAIALLTFYCSFHEKLILPTARKPEGEAALHPLLFLLTQILEKFTQAEQNTETFTDIFENATVLFADIAGFTKYSSSVEPEEVVNMLRILFQNFDEFCQKLGVYKLFTIGDCYVCMGILDANNRDEVEEAVNVTLFGLKMIDIINSINKDPRYQHLNMRIGAHTGKIIGGVVGTDVVRYDVYGEDVTIANKMESNGQEGKMMVSQATKDLIESVYEDMFEFEFSKEVYISSKDLTISAYFVSLSQSQYE